MDNDLAAVCDDPSVTRTVNVEAPASTGVPRIAPFGLRDNPAGKLPDVTFHEYGGAPPSAAKDAEYATFTAPSGKAVVDTVSAAGSTRNETSLVSVSVPSVSRTENEKAPAVVGIPLTMPAALKLKPGGRGPP
jgi:hypothetical protein